MAEPFSKSPEETIAALQAGRLTFNEVLQQKERPPPAWRSGEWLTLGSVAAAAASPNDRTNGAWRRVAILGYEQTTESPSSSIMERAAFHRLHIILEQGSRSDDSYRDPTWFFRWLRDLTRGRSPREFARQEEVSDHLVRLIHAAVEAIATLAQQGVAVPEDAQHWLDATPSVKERSSP